MNVYFLLTSQVNVIWVRRWSSALCSHSGAQGPSTLWKAGPSSGISGLSNQLQDGADKDCTWEIFINQSWKGLTQFLLTFYATEGLSHVAIPNYKHRQAGGRGEPVLVSSRSFYRTGHSHFPAEEKDSQISLA